MKKRLKKSKFIHFSVGAVYVHAWVSHLCMHKRVEAHVRVRCPSVATVDDHIHLTGQMTRTKNHTHSVCTILHMHKVRGGDVFV